MKEMATPKGLDLRSPDDRKTFRNRVAKELQPRTTLDLREQAAKLTGKALNEFNRQSAISVIADHRLDSILSIAA